MEVRNKGNIKKKVKERKGIDNERKKRERERERSESDLNSVCGHFKAQNKFP